MDSATTPPSSLMAVNFKFWIRRPELILDRAKYEAWKQFHPGSPWWCPETVRTLNSLLNRSMRLLEFGTGRSTIWLSKRCRHLTAVEHDAKWFAKVNCILEENNLHNVDLILAPLDHSICVPEQETSTPFRRTSQYWTEYRLHRWTAQSSMGHIERIA